MSESSGIRRCANRCFFCFVDGLPKGLRKSLYVKDDDLLHSFLFGNFVTLTNLRDADWRRLETQRLSPLYVSVHATDLVRRREMLGNPKAPDIMEQLERLGRLRIQVHAQIVLCPGANDGEQLAKTVEDLASLHPTIQSIAVVPVGITKHTIERKGDLLSRPSAADAVAAINLISPFQKRFRRELGSSLVYLADELYLMSGIPIPPAGQYDDFPQIGNGIGMTRKLMDEWRRVQRKLSTSPLITPSRVGVVTGTLIASLFATIIDGFRQFGLTGLEHVPIVNGFFGPSVTVSGLLTGSDLISAFRQRRDVDLIVIPRNMLNADGERFLDDLTPADVEREIGTRIEPARTLHQVVTAVSSLVLAR